MNTTMGTGTRGPGPGIRVPGRQAPPRDDARRQDLRRGDLRRGDARGQDPGGDDPRRQDRRRGDPDADPRGLDPGRAATRGLRTRPARPGMPGRRGLAGRPGRADRPARPAAQPTDGARLAHPASRAARDTPGPAHIAGAGRRPASRTPFILLVLALLGCGLICLLVINTTLAAASFRISDLQRQNTDSAQRVQELQQQVSTDQSASTIEQRALRLGMRPQQTLNFIDLKTGRRYTTPAHVRGVYAVPGYTP
jgi:hypothetical protein